MIDVSTKVKYKNIVDNLSVSLIFYLFSIVFELTSSVLSLGHVPKYFYVSLLIIHLWAFVIFLVPTKSFRRVIAIFLIILQTTIGVTNDILYKASGEIFTFDKFFLASEAIGTTGTLNFRMVDFGHLFLYIILAIFAIFCLFIVPKAFKEWKATKKQFMAIMCLYVFLLMSFFGCVSVSLTERYRLLETQFPSTLSYQTFGYYAFYTMNSFSTMKSLKTNTSVNPKLYDEYKSYFLDGNNPAKNEYSGVSEGNNLITILAESFDSAMIDEHFTPNLYKLWFEDGMQFKNYYAENKTNMSEGMVLFGSYSRAQTMIAHPQTADVAKYFSLAKLLKTEAKTKESEIANNYFHSFNSTFYKRDMTYSKVGFDNLYFADLQEDDIKEYNKISGQEYDWTAKYFSKFIKDSNFFEYNQEKIIPDEGRFYSHYATVVTHGEYEQRGSNTEYYQILTSAENSVYYNKMIEDMHDNGYYPENVNRDSFLYYKASVMDFDKMIGLLFERLEATNNLENTTVVIFPDHNSYYDNISYFLRGVSEENVRNCNVSSYNMGAVIYDQKLTAKYKGEESYSSGVIVDKFVSVNDIYPTICDIMNLPYNLSLCYGQSVFDENESIFMSLKDDRYIFNKDYYYFEDKVYNIKTNEITENKKFEESVLQVLNKFDIQEDLYSNQKSFIKILKTLGY
ncbi:MAG: sulfatase-like hydrolase/transferase [Clostridia bacterium]|nr:sulfatase-like hydrolase/transferase [Clostridia bacterium]